METIFKLKCLGFEVSLDSNQIRYSFKETGEPDTAQALRLLNELKQNKVEAVAYLRKEEVYNIFQKAIKEINSLSQEWEEVFEYLYKKNPELNQRIDEAQANIDRIYKENGCLEDIKQAIWEWQELNLEALRFLKQ